MTGTGTQLDPYIIETWSDFITAAGTASAYAEFKKDLVLTSDTSVDPDKLYVDVNGDVQTNVQASDLPELYENTLEFDLNDIHPEAYTNTINVSCTSLKGNGATIKNISFSNCDCFTLAADTVINGLKIKNFSAFADSDHYQVIKSSSLNSYASILDYCMFSGRMDGQNIGQGQYSVTFCQSAYGQAHSCSFNLDMIGNTYFRTSYANRRGFELFNCRVNLSGSPNPTVEMLMQNCYISGSAETGTFKAADESRYSVFDIACSSLLGGNNLSTVLANSDKCSSIGAELAAVTTAQLHDAAYLSSIGFPIQI